MTKRHNLTQLEAMLIESHERDKEVAANHHWQGRQAHDEGQSLWANPFEHGTREHDEWMSGWNAAEEIQPQWDAS